LKIASPICFKLFWHCDRRAASRACWTAGNSNETRTAMMAITTKSSISVNPLLRDGMEWCLLKNDDLK
jgi:hypothetical protein